MSKKRKKRRNKSLKGGIYEREVCNLLSDWWIPGRSDIFWRAAGSGNRARVRGRRGKTTYGQHGDVSATDPIGDPLIQALTIEIKRGYSYTNIHALLDRPNLHLKQTEYDVWIQKAIESCEHSKSFAWLLITRRDKRTAMVFMPWRLTKALQAAGCWVDKPIPFATFQCAIKFTYTEGRKQRHEIKQHRISVTTLEQWLSCVSPTDIKGLLK
jgi:hypothetical protein